MAAYDFRARRLFVEDNLGPNAALVCTPSQANHLLNVLRLGPGAPILVFNGRDGEWRAEIAETGRRTCRLRIAERVRAQEAGPDIRYLFAPLKRGRLDYMVQKAVEMGVSRLSPVLTHRTQVVRVNLARMRANAIEAAEQCGILAIPEIDAPVSLETALGSWDADRPLVYCDESAPICDPIASLSRLAPGPIAVLIGPEGGFDENEWLMVMDHSFTIAISLGPRILRADTAAVAALALIDAALGDWRGGA